MKLGDVILVASGGAFGAVLRYYVGVLSTEFFGTRFPWGTLFVNVLGCFLLGWLVQSAAGSFISEATRLTLGTGVLGAFTTFSTFGVETILAWNRSPMVAVANVATSVVLGLLAAAAGMYLGARLAAT